MQSQILSPRHYSRSSRGPMQRILQPSYRPTSPSSQPPRSPLPSPTPSTHSEHVLEGMNDSRTMASIHPDSQVKHIVPASLYLTFNAPRTDDYHRGIFLTYRSQEDVNGMAEPENAEDDPWYSEDSTDPKYLGTLYHAVYETSKDIPTHHWHSEGRPVNVSTSQTAVLLYRLGTLDPEKGPIQDQFGRITEVLQNVPVTRAEREKRAATEGLAPLRPGQGNPKLEDYDCMIWTEDALTALDKAGFCEFGGKTAEQIMKESRAEAGPADARTMVGKHVNGLIRVLNDPHGPKTYRGPL